MLWPDFDERDLMLAVADFQNRERHFGVLPPDRNRGEPGHGDSLLDPARWKRLLKVRP